MVRNSKEGYVTQGCGRDSMILNRIEQQIRIDVADLKLIHEDPQPTQFNRDYDLVELI